MTTAIEPLTRAEVVSILMSLIDRDPGQPRFAENVDTDLEASFREHGWFPDEPLKVRPHPENPDRFMLVNGERRYAGAKAAGLKEALCVLSLDEEGVSEADRLIVQIVSNTGKPLTPIEEAIAFKRIIDDRRRGTPELITKAEARKRGLLQGENGVEFKGDELIQVPGKDADPKYGAVALARELGMSKSTVTDRLAATEIPDFWRPFIVKGPLQASHIPALHKIRAMPEKYQLRVLTRLQDLHSWPYAGGKRPGDYKRHTDNKGTDERIQVEEFDRMLQEALRPFVRPLKDVGPSYKGPTAKLKDGGGYYSSVKVMAIDPTQWEPILRKRRAETAKKTRAAGGADAKAQKQVDRWRQEQAQREEENRRENEVRRRWWKARPEILVEFAEAIQGLSLAQLQAAVIDTIGAGKASKMASKHLGKGTTAEQFLRHLALAAFIKDADWQYGFREKATKAGKRFGVDAAAVVKADREDKRPDPATTDSGEAGDGLTVGAGDDEDGGDDA